MSPYLQGQIFGLLEDSRWDIAYLGMQIIIESLALGCVRRPPAPHLRAPARKLLRYVMADEARHVAFGVVSLGEYYQGLTVGRVLGAPGVSRREHAAQPACDRPRPRCGSGMGLDHRAGSPEPARGGHATAHQALCGVSSAAFFSKLVPNVRKLGLLEANDGYLRNKWGEGGLLEFEFAEDTAADFESYDSLAADRAAAAATTAARAPGPGVLRLRRPGLLRRPDLRGPGATNESSRLVSGGRRVAHPGRSCASPTPRPPATPPATKDPRGGSTPPIRSGRVRRSRLNDRPGPHARRPKRGTPLCRRPPGVRAGIRRTRRPHPGCLPALLVHAGHRAGSGLPRRCAGPAPRDAGDSTSAAARAGTPTPWGAWASRWSASTSPPPS